MRKKFMMEGEEKMWIYFDSALEKVSRANVVETFMKVETFIEKWKTHVSDPKYRTLILLLEE